MARRPLLSFSNSSSEPSCPLLRDARHLVLLVLLFPGGPNCGLARGGKPDEVTKFDFNATIRDPNRCALVKFTVPYCAHCQMLRKVWDELHDRFSGAEHAEDDDLSALFDPLERARELSEHFSSALISTYADAERASPPRTPPRN